MRLLTGLFCFIGLTFMGAGIYNYLLTRDFLSTAIKAEGTVVKLEKHRSQESTSYTPVVRFTPPSGDGPEIQFASSVSSSPPAYKVGEKVTVLFPPGKPRDARISGFLDLWFLAALFSFMGVIFTFVSVMVVVVSRDGRRRLAAFPNGFAANRHR